MRGALAELRWRQTRDVMREDAVAAIHTWAQRSPRRAPVMTSSTPVAGGRQRLRRRGRRASLVEGISVDTARSACSSRGSSVRDLRAGEAWRLEPRSRTLEDPLHPGQPLAAGRPRLPTRSFVGAVDVSIERDAERQRSFERARDAAEQFRERDRLHLPGCTSISSLDCRRVGHDSARELREHQVRAALHALTAANAA